MSTIYLPKIDHNTPIFPNVEQALHSPNGLLAFGGKLNENTLIKAYQQGIFPWFNDDEPILWWSPNPRMVLKTNEVYISKSMKREIKKNRYQITVDNDFLNVIHSCKSTRISIGSWITNNMQTAYLDLHKNGYAHSVEVWNEDKDLVGGLYGISLDRMFFGESMFSKEPNTSKLALIYLCQLLMQNNIHYIDCQVANPHLQSMGGINIPRSQFTQHLLSHCTTTESIINWKKLQHQNCTIRIDKKLSI